MPVEIRLLPRYQLCTTDRDTNLLELPVIELAPLGNNLPHLKRIAYSVRGTPSDLAAQVESVYREFSFDKPIKLFTPQRLKHADCQLDRPLPADVNCTLQVSVRYFDSDAEGNLDGSAPKEIRAECYLWSTPAPEPPPIPPQPQPKQQNSQEIGFPGWLAIDFGTSNSTVTLFDPRGIPSINGLPKEQEKRLRERLAQWLSQSPADALPGVSASEWEEFINDISQSLGTDPKRLSDIFSDGTSSLLLKAILQIDHFMGTRSEVFRKAANKNHSQIYHEAFRVLPLEWQSLIPVELDALRRLTEISSELEIVSLEPLTILMGERARQDRNNAIATATSITWNEIKGKFHHSPKRYLGQERSIKVNLDGKEDDIAVRRLTQAAWAHLIHLTEECRQRIPDSFSKGRFNTAVVTYPATAPPVVRREIEKLVYDLGVKDVQISYDEAVSVAIFFLWREFGGDLNIGIESFKSRCHQDGDKWVQNVLVLDIGGGTTDLALISLTLKEDLCEDLFEENEDRGKGGRYYILTPKLLGSSGNLQLGGELITLRIFLLLKAAIADCLLTAVSEGSLQSDTLENRLSELDERFLDNGKFRRGSILKCVDKENLEGDSVYKDALKAAEKVIPTHWAKTPSHVGTFYALWEHAEEAKITLGKKPQTEDSFPPLFVLSWDKISNLLKQSQIDFQAKDPDSLSVTLNSQQFEKAVIPVIEQVIGIAKGLMESRLRIQDANSNNSLPKQQNAKSNKKHIDWLILSGKTCNLHLVEREIYQEFSQSEYFVWNPERVTFVPEYSKIATSAGACYAEKLRRLIYASKASKEMIIRGANQLRIDVKNLFYFLPCYFELLNLGREPLTIFEAGQELYQLDPSGSVAKARSRRLGVSLSMIVKRRDFEAMGPQLWGSFNGQALADRLGMSEYELREEITVEFEIDHKLQFSLLLCRKAPHRLISADVSGIDIKAALSTASLGEDMQALISDNGQLLCDIAINVAESATVYRTDAHTLVFEAGKDYSKSLEVFRYDDDAKPQQGRGLISDPLTEFPLSGKHTFYFRHPQTKQWTRIGELSRPGSETEYPCKYYVALDDKGILRLYTGEVPYWTSDNPDCLKQEGCVFRTELELQPRDVDEKRDPFCGIH